MPTISGYSVDVFLSVYGRWNRIKFVAMHVSYMAGELLLSWMHVNGSLFLSWNVYTSVCSYAAVGLRLLILMYATGYPGEILIRALQELVLPLMVFALMSGVFNLRHNQGGWVKLFPLLFRICWRHGAISGPLFMLNVLISRFLLLAHLLLLSQKLLPSMNDLLGAS